MKDIHTTLSQIDYAKNNGLVPAIIQDAVSNKVLMLGYLNQEALEKTLKEKRVTFFSRSKNRLWTKGETSGNYLDLVDLKVDCDRDTLLIKVHPHGPTCHTGADTCFNETNAGDDFLFHLQGVIQDRKANPTDSSYTTKLFQKGINKIAQKVGEEAVELIIEAKDEDKTLFMGEAADLLYHFLVLLSAKGYELEEVLQVLRKRHQ